MQKNFQMPRKHSFVNLHNQVAGRQYYLTVQDGEQKQETFSYGANNRLVTRSPGACMSDLF